MRRLSLTSYDVNYMAFCRQNKRDPVSRQVKDIWGMYVISFTLYLIFPDDASCINHRTFQK